MPIFTMKVVSIPLISPIPDTPIQMKEIDKDKGAFENGKKKKYLISAKLNFEIGKDAHCAK